MDGTTFGATSALDLGRLGDAVSGALPLLLLCGGLVVLVFWLLKRLRHWRNEALRLRSQLHGERVRGGVNSEALAPLLDDFPVDVARAGTSTVFLGQPIDYVHFDPEHGVVFVEVKSGNSQLSARQRALRDRIEAGEVSWAVYRVPAR